MLKVVKKSIKKKVKSCTLHLIASNLKKYESHFISLSNFQYLVVYYSLSSHGFFLLKKFLKGRNPKFQLLK